MHLRPAPPAIRPFQCVSCAVFVHTRPDWMTLDPPPTLSTVDEGCHKSVPRFSRVVSYGLSVFAEVQLALRSDVSTTFACSFVHDQMRRNEENWDKREGVTSNGKAGAQ